MPEQNKQQVRLEVSTVDMGNVAKFEGLRNPETGEFRVAIQQLVKLFPDSVNQKHVSRDVKSALGENFYPHKYHTNRTKGKANNKPENTISLEQFKQVISHFAQKGNSKAIEMYNQLNPEFPIKEKTRKTPKQKEKNFQNKLSKKFNGETEIPCKTGIIDIVTETKIIEVKKIIDWKHAIGQISVYGLEFPNKQKTIALFGDTSNEMKQMIILFCKELNIEVIFED